MPSAVHREIVANGQGWTAARDIQVALAEATWMEVRVPTAGPLLDRLRQRLDAGEAEALALGQQMGLPILLDEADARRVAKWENLSFFGSLGVLARGKAAGRIAAVAPILREMRAAGIRFGDELTAAFLRQVGES